MVVASGDGESKRPVSSRRRTVRDLASVGAVVGCVAVGIAALVSPATQDLRSVVPGISPVTAPETDAPVGDIAVEVRPGASRPRITAIPSLVANEVAATAVVPSVLSTAGNVAGFVTQAVAGAPAAIAVDLPATAPVVAVSAELAPPPPSAPAPTTLTTVVLQSATAPGKGKKNGVTKKSPTAESPPPTYVVASAGGGGTSADRDEIKRGKADGSPGHERSADTTSPRDLPHDRVPPHAAAHRHR